MAYVLATTENTVRWYSFDPLRPATGKYELLQVLVLDQVPAYATKDNAKVAAQKLGLKTWRYVKI